MASPNTKKIESTKQALRSRTVISIKPAGHGPNRAARRNAKKPLRLRPKMKAEKRAQVIDWKKKAAL